MRGILEFLIFLVIGALATLIGGLVLWLVGRPFQFEFSRSVILAGIGLVFVFPGAANIWIALRDSDGETPAQRVCTAIRGFGMLLCAVAVALPFIVRGAGVIPTVILFVLGLLLWYGSLPVSDHLESQRLRKLGLLAETNKDRVKSDTGGDHDPRNAPPPAF
ncbi:MAG: hypothetical protein AB1641_03590 [Thermodesulfobacteriota bacterium]